MWHNHEGGLVVLTDKPGLRVEEVHLHNVNYLTRMLSCDFLK